MADSGADTTLITRKAAEWINVKLGALSKDAIVTPFGKFEAYHALVRIDVLYKGRRVDLGKTPVRIPEKDTAELGHRPFIIAGRSNIFDQYLMKFDGYGQTLTMERMAAGQTLRTNTGTA